MLAGLHSPQGFFLCPFCQWEHPQPVMPTQEEEYLWGRSIYTIASLGMRHEAGWWFPLLLCQLASHGSTSVLPDCYSFQGSYLVGWRSVQQGAGVSWITLSWFGNGEAVRACSAVGIVLPICMPVQSHFTASPAVTIHLSFTEDLCLTLFWNISIISVLLESKTQISVIDWRCQEFLLVSMTKYHSVPC